MIHSDASYLQDLITAVCKIALIMWKPRDSSDANARASAGLSHLLYVLSSAEMMNFRQYLTHPLLSFCFLTITRLKMLTFSTLCDSGHPVDSPLQSTFSHLCADCLQTANLSPMQMRTP